MNYTGAKGGVTKGGITKLAKIPTVTPGPAER